ncbi:MAG: condensation domain-containing protein, partial [Ruminococcus sp.]
MINLYGPTESTVCITAFELDRLYDRVHIGKALDNTKLYVVDKQGRRLPPCVPGELWVAGHGVSRGYLNRPEQNEKAFIRNPFTNEKGYERVYRTGDIVRFLPDGNIDFVGRNDGQVKIRGFRIELSEVERIIREFEGIKDATVAAFDEPNGGKFIAAYVVSDSKVDIQKLNEFILENKPPYMVPAVTMQIDRIPLNQNQKVNKRALPKPEKKAQNDESSSKPMTLLEKKIHSIIAKILGNDNFSVTENLLFAGLNSLSVIKLAVELHKEFGFEADVKQMMKECSVISIEDQLQEYLMSGALAKNTAETKQKEYKSLYPLSKTQLGVYFDCMKNPYTTLYNIPSFLKFTRSINADKLAQSVKKVILAHPYIFTHLTTENDDVEQVYPDNRQLDIPVKKMTEKEIELLKKEFVKPFNFSKSPLFRTLVVETEKNIYLFADFHHIVFDGASYNIFLSQLKAAYEGDEIKPEDYTYFDYIDDEIKAESSEEYGKAEKFFDDMMKNFESASEITPDLGSQGDNGRLAEVIVPFDLAKIEAFCNKNGVTPAQLFLAAAFYSVSRFTNSRNVYLSTISNGRSDMRLTDCFGMFVKTLPLGIEIEDISALEFVKKSKSVFTGAIENEIYPYSKICSKFGFAPNIMYEYQIGVTDDLIIDGEAVERDFFDMEITKFKTAIYIENYKNQPCIVVRYNEALYSKDLMQTLVKSIFNTTMHIISAPDSRIRKISMLDDSQIDELKGFSLTSIAPVETKLLHKMFENQVEKTPDNNAITACDGTLTYRELNRRANVTANGLIARGLKKGGRVVVLLSRTSKIFSTIFGILKAGGAFIPTCPDYPQERINSIIE